MAIVCLLYTNIFQLDSLKWYKDGQEFFRVVTGPVSQEAKEFAAHGVNIDQDQVRFHPSIHPSGRNIVRFTDWSDGLSVVSHHSTPTIRIHNHHHHQNHLFCIIFFSWHSVKIMEITSYYSHTLSFLPQEHIGNQNHYTPEQ